ncbi:MAG: hypothetical protein WB713_13530, partial [Methyloceanibacter sp.]
SHTFDHAMRVQQRFHHSDDSLNFLVKASQPDKGQVLQSSFVFSPCHPSEHSFVGRLCAHAMNGEIPLGKALLDAFRNLFHGVKIALRFQLFSASTPATVWLQKCHLLKV